MCERGRYRSADEAACVPDHEGHLLGCDIFRCDDEVAFVFTVCRVEDYDEFAFACRTSCWLMYRRVRRSLGALEG